MNERIKQSIDAFIEKEEANIFRDIARLVAVNREDMAAAGDDAPWL